MAGDKCRFQHEKQTAKEQKSPASTPKVSAKKEAPMSPPSHLLSPTSDITPEKIVYQSVAAMFSEVPSQIMMEPSTPLLPPVASPAAVAAFTNGLSPPPLSISSPLLGAFSMPRLVPEEVVADLPSPSITTTSLQAHSTPFFSSLMAALDEDIPCAVLDDEFDDIDFSQDVEKALHFLHDEDPTDSRDTLSQL
jgi:hypothetical protein